jgi:hypothetical protein
MVRLNVRMLVLAAGLAIAGTTVVARGQTPLGTAFSYQGELRSLPDNAVLTGTATLKFRLYDAALGGNRLGMNGTINATFELTRTSVPLTDGRFTINDLDFGTAFGADARFLEVVVQRAGQPARNRQVPLSVR